MLKKRDKQLKEKLKKTKIDEKEIEKVLEESVKHLPFDYKKK